MNGIAMVEMPRYKCHKEVWALQVKSVSLPPLLQNEEWDGKQLQLVFEDSRYAPIFVDSPMFSRYSPKQGDYYVVYSDGYKSFSPKQAFEEGYSKL
jgi:hypothetical protein